MKPTLQLRTSQHLTLTPQLQQSIRLLQLSTLELQQEVEHALTQNPMLEREDDWLAGSVRVGTDGSLRNERSTSASSASEGHESANGHDETRELDGQTRFDDSNQDSGSDWSLNDFARSGSASDDDDNARPQLHVDHPNLREHLLAQLRLTKAGPRDRALVEFLIESLDEDGYLGTMLDEIQADMPEELALETEEINAALALLQSFDPAGVGARTPSECLRLQLQRLPPSNVRTLSLRIVSDHLELLAARDYTRLRRLLGVSEDSLRAAHHLIRSLDPFPGAAYGSPQADYVVPDVLVRKQGSNWIAELNPEVMPRLRINEMYARILRNNRNDPGTGNLQQQLQEARWLIKNIQQRFDTILRVAQAIVERQKNFFTHGEIGMRPLVLREIADTLGLHESTISRVTTSKYMLTPFGTFELKYFFGSHVATEAGGAASSTAIRALIKQLIGAEDPQSPLSDSRIAELLAEQGFVVARRTVAKYREAMRIPAVNLRKSL
ncbi:RNA polymerase factor sigma-54 [Pandoraea pnomenusa]|uniref:RNA polymerase sigma-54 factor n=2 Tax=Burkholderiaceae TaxID=119060 RepID=A0A378YTJ4_9BURK|nr:MULTISPECIES: RNA polymerase factor sigma-54 [Pandoraea]AHB07514.1 RNA polymerase subunit sigma-54 [Pandoraea pnomenusa 3kgm]AHB76295.1 RNA polymerase factor sigma-54 [Pandoraea pnomenusa]AHN75382.1 RNA polymerase sigma-54 factor [Pandoraea pnomenusa]AIU28040.1 RNA polymerase sigma-54 factor [Pandoraea pnomenusa]ANC45181.1 RNA polymerase factor sigma-54 [Pandoraea pnomenusa]